MKQLIFSPGVNIPLFGLCLMMLSACGGGSSGGTTATYSYQQQFGSSQLSSARISHAATALNDGTILITGGHDGNMTLNTIEQLDPVSESFSMLTKTINIARNDHTATLLNNGKVLITGGRNGSSLNLPNFTIQRLVSLLRSRTL